MKLSEITTIIEDFAPLSLQESYDNAGLSIGDKNMNIDAALLCIDITEEVIDEAISKNCNLIISHHPLIFSGLKKINGKNYIERCIIKAIKNDIAIYSSHTNCDATEFGVSYMMAKKLNLKNISILAPLKDSMKKVVFFCPISDKKRILEDLFKAGAGKMGNYDSCSFSSEGEGSFKANINTNPYIGEIDKLHLEKECRVEVLVKKHLVNKVIYTLLNSHPYEEVAYDIINTEIKDKDLGFGIIGDLEYETNVNDFLHFIKNTFECDKLRYSNHNKKTIKKVALCGGSGAFLIQKAIDKKADIYISGDIKYHDYFCTENEMIIADIGHYESEQFTKHIFYELLTKKIPTFVVRFSEVNTNPINYI